MQMSITCVVNMPNVTDAKTTEEKQVLKVSNVDLRIAENAKFHRQAFCLKEIQFNRTEEH